MRFYGCYWRQTQRPPIKYSRGCLTIPGKLKFHPLLFNSMSIKRMIDFQKQKSRDMTKPTKWVCAQRRLRSAWASAQSDPSLRCPHEEKLGSLATHWARTAKTRVSLGGCPGWSESSLVAHSLCWFCHVAAQIKWVLKDNFLVFQTRCGYSIVSPHRGDFNEYPKHIIVGKILPTIVK